MFGFLCSVSKDERFKDLPDIAFKDFLVVGLAELQLLNHPGIVRQPEFTRPRSPRSVRGKDKLVDPEDLGRLYRMAGPPPPMAVS